MVRRSIAGNNNPSVSSTNTNVPLYIGLIWVILLNLVIGGGVLTPPALAAAASVNEATRTNNTDATNTAANTPTTTTSPATAAQVSRARQSYSRLPLAFEVNTGQTDSVVRYLARGQGYSLFFTDDGTATLDLRKGGQGQLDDPTAQHGNGKGNDKNKSGSQAQSTGSDGQNDDTNAPITDIALALKLIGAKPTGQPTAEKPLAATSNYFTGNNPAQWQTGLKNYGQLTYKGVYQGIDLSYTGQQEQLEYQFRVAPGSDVNQIAFQFEGVNKATLQSDGSLVLSYGSEKITQSAPVIYQTDPKTGQRQNVSGGFTLIEKSGNSASNKNKNNRGRHDQPAKDALYQIGFKVTGSYDHTRPLVIDPVLSYSTFVGGAGVDSGTGIKVDSAGNAYVSGYTLSTDFPTTAGAYQTSYKAGSTTGGYDVFITKLSPDGSTLLYSTYLGGSQVDLGLGMDLYSDGQVYLTGATTSPDFPTTAGAYSTTLAVANGYSMFVARLSVTGTLNYSTLIGGDGGDYGRAIVVNPSNPNLIYVAGESFGNISGFPTTANAFQRTVSGDHFDGLVVQLDLTKTGTNQLAYSSYYGGNGEDVIYALGVDTGATPVRFYVSGYTTSTNLSVTQVAANGFGPAYHATKTNSAGGLDSFLAVLSPGAVTTTLLYGTYLGGSWDEQANGLSLDANKNVYIVGQSTKNGTSTADFPTTANALEPTAPVSSTQQPFLIVISPTVVTPTQQLLYSSYLGGSGQDRGLAVLADPAHPRQVWVSGVGNSLDLPTTSGAFEPQIPANGQGGDHAFVMKVDTTITGTAGLLYGTHLAGSTLVRERAAALAADSSGNVYVTGYTTSPDFPTTTGAFQTSTKDGYDAFVTKLSADGSSLGYSTYLGGGSAETAGGVAVGFDGSLYLAGQTNSTQFPTTTGAVHSSTINPDGSFTDQANHLFAVKLSPDGSGLSYASYIGGTGTDQVGNNAALDSNGNFYVVGYTTSADFPTTTGAYQTSFGTGVIFKTVLLRLNSTGGLSYSTYFGGNNSTVARSVAVSGDGSRVYLAGSTSSDAATFPLKGAYQSVNNGGNDAFLAVLNPVGSGVNDLVNSTFLGGNGSDGVNSVGLDGLGGIYLTGVTGQPGSPIISFPTTATAYQRNYYSVALTGSNAVFVTKFTTSGGNLSLSYSTLLGGNAGNQGGRQIVADSAGNAYLMGFTTAANFPTSATAYQKVLTGTSDLFVTKLNPTGSGLLYSTLLGGNGSENCTGSSGLALDTQVAGQVVGAACTNSTNFPVAPSDKAYQTALGGGTDAVAFKLSSDGSRLVYSTYLGGSGNDVSNGVGVDRLGNIYLGGSTSSPDFPITFGAYDTTNGGGQDSFGARINQVQLVFITQPVGGPALPGQPLSQQPVVQVQSLVDGSVITTYNTPISLTLRTDSGTPGASLGGVTVVATPVGGTAVFTNVAVSLAGQGYVLTAHGALLDPADSAPFNVGGGAGQAATIRPYSGNNQSAQTSNQFVQPLVAQVLDSQGQPVNGANVTFTAPQELYRLVGVLRVPINPTGFFAGVNPNFAGTTDSNGLITTSIFTANRVVGSYNVTATVAGVSQPALFNLSNTNATTDPDISFKLSPVVAGPEPLSSTMTVTATLRKHAIVPIANQPINLSVSSDVTSTYSVPITTDASGVATYTYSRSFTTTDSLNATSVVNGVSVSANPTSTIYWYNPTAQFSTDAVTGLFFKDQSSFQNLTPSLPAVFTQTFPTLLFNPPDNTVANQTINYTMFPFTDIVLDGNGAQSGTIVAQGNGYIAGGNNLLAFDAVFKGNFVVAASGPITLNFAVDNSYQLGIGPSDSGQQLIASSSSSSCANFSPQATTPYYNYSVVSAFAGAYNFQCQVVLTFPAAGKYPFEIDYYEDGQGWLSLSMVNLGNNKAIGNSGSVVLAPATSSNSVFQNQSFTATVLDAAGRPVSNTDVVLNVSGANSQSLLVATNNSGVATFSYQGNFTGTDQVQATAWARGNILNSNLANVTWTYTTTVPPAGSCQTLSGWVVTPTLQAVILGQSAVVITNGLTLPANTVVQLYPSDQPDAAHITTLTQLSAAFTGDGHTSLTTLDGTQLANGSYILRIAYTDAQGYCRSSLTPFSVIGENKPGRVTFSLTDFTVPLAGLPLSLVRTYDSLNRNRQGDFGYGWSLTLGDPHFQADPSGDVTFDTLDGKRVKFYFSPSFLFNIGQPSYTAEPGQYGTLEAKDCGALLYSGGGFYCPLGGSFPPSSYQYRDPYGRLYNISRPTNSAGQPTGGPFRLDSLEDLNGNLLTFDYQGVKASNPHAQNLIPTGYNGDSYLVRYGRNATTDTVCPNCITTITDTLGHVYNYSYAPITTTVSNLGDLVKVSYPQTMPGSSTQPISATYSYYTSAAPALTHFFKSASDPNGNVAATAQYYNDGRLSAVTNALGQQTSYAYTIDPATSFVTTTVTNPPDPFTGVSVAMSMTNDAYGKVLTQTDELGRVTAHQYDANHNPVVEVLPNPTTGQATTTGTGSRVRSYQYDPATGKDQPTKVTDSLGNFKTTSYNPYGGPVALSDPYTPTQTPHVYNVGYNDDFMPKVVNDHLGAVGGYEFDGRGSIQTRYDGNNHPTAFSYDTYGNVNTQKDALGNTLSYSYDTMGRMTFMTDAVGIASKYEYDYMGHLLTSTIAYTSTTKAQRTVYTYDANGNKTSEKDALGRFTTYQYDALNRLITTTYPVVNGQLYTTVKGYDWRGNVVTDTDQLGRITRYQYDQGGQLITTTYALNTPDTATSVVGYDLAGRKVLEYNVFTGTVPPGGNISNVPATKYGYDSEGRILTVTNQLDGALGGSHSTYYQYDAAGRRLGQTDGNNNSITFTLDERGRVVTTTYPAPTSGAAVISTVQQYDLAGQVLTSTDGGGRATTYRYDAANRLQAVINPMNQATQYSYDPAGRLTGILDANNHKTGFVYDELGRQHYKIWPDNSYEQFEYDLVGNQTAHRLTDGLTNTMGYDSWNRLTKAVYADNPVRTVVYTYTATSQRQSVSDSSYGTTNYQYNGRDWVTQVTQPNNQFVGYKYDVRGNRVGLTITSTGILSTTSYGYSDANQLTSVTDSANNTTSFSYDNGGRRSTATLPGSVGIAVQYGYDQLNRLTGITQTKGVSVFAAYTYALDGAGNRIAITETSSYAPNRNLRYQYDPAYRLLAEWDSTQSGGITTTYGYDAAGNRLTMQTGAATPVRYGYNELDQLKSLTDTNNIVSLYNYRRGDLLQIRNTGTGSTTNYTWDAADRLIGASGNNHTLSFGYDADGHRVRQQQDSSSPINYLWDNYSQYGDVLLETTGTGASTFQASYVLAGGELISQNKGGATSYFLKDGQGSTRALVNSSGGIIQNYNYSAFGNLQNTPGSYSTNYLYTGQQFDNLSGLYDLRARYYNPGDGRFLSQDTWFINFNHPIELDRYSYTANNPINWADPSGYGQTGEYGIGVNTLFLILTRGPIFVGLGLLVSTLIIAAVLLYTGDAVESDYNTAIHDPSKNYRIVVKRDSSGRPQDFVIICSTLTSKSLILLAQGVVSLLGILLGLIITNLAGKALPPVAGVLLGQAIAQIPFQILGNVSLRNNRLGFVILSPFTISVFVIP